MRHPTDGTLRRLLDEPAGVADADREHVASCPVCLSGLADAERDAAAASAALHVAYATGVDATNTDAAWHRLSRAVTVEAPRRTTTATGPARRWRKALRSPVVAGFAVAALLAGGSAAAATDWLQIFRAEQVAPVTAPEADLIQLPDLSDFGEVEVTEPIDVRGVADAEAAEQATGLTVPLLNELPRGVRGAPTYHVGGRASAVFTFSFEKATRFAAAAGKTLPPPPPDLDGAQFRLTAGPGFAAVWSQGRPVPALVVARVVAPTAHSSGIPFETARDYLLSLPVVPENVASQLRSFSGDGTTLPLFMSVEEMTSSTADVNGMPATVLASRDGVMATVVWVEEGVVTAVAGSLSTDEVLAVARGLRWSR
jgi:hypothetical protein